MEGGGARARRIIDIKKAPSVYRGAFFHLQNNKKTARNTVILTMYPGRLAALRMIQWIFDRLAVL